MHRKRLDNTLFHIEGDNNRRRSIVSKFVFSYSVQSAPKTADRPQGSNFRMLS